MREGEKWFYEVSNFFSTLTDIENVTYCGFEQVNINNRSYTSGVFEFDSSVCFNDFFITKTLAYESEKVLCMRAMEKVGTYRHCVVVVLR